MARKEIEVETEEINISPIVVVIIGIVIIFIAALLATGPSRPNKTICSDECSSLNLSFYKVENRGGYAGGDFCWCIGEDKIPHDIGSIR